MSPQLLGGSDLEGITVKTYLGTPQLSVRAGILTVDRHLVAQAKRKYTRLYTLVPERRDTFRNGF